MTMATQFYKPLDEFMKISDEIIASREQRRQRIAKNETTNEDYNDELARLKTNMQQLGVNQASEQEQSAIDRSTRMQFIKEHNIKQGTPRWFRVMYARPELTGEDPFGE